MVLFGPSAHSKLRQALFGSTGHAHIPLPTAEIPLGERGD